jgi:hypothetical protein
MLLFNQRNGTAFNIVETKTYRAHPFTHSLLMTENVMLVMSYQSVYITSIATAFVFTTLVLRLDSLFFVARR